MGMGGGSPGSQMGNAQRNTLSGPGGSPDAGTAASARGYQSLVNNIAAQQQQQEYRQQQETQV